MTTKPAYKLWTFDLVHHVPVTPHGGGEITWVKRTEWCEIYLPADIEYPAQYLSDSGMENCADILDYQWFCAHESL